jgi:hypothetical protein
VSLGVTVSVYLFLNPIEERNRCRATCSGE